MVSYSVAHGTARSAAVHMSDMKLYTVGTAQVACIYQKSRLIFSNSLLYVRHKDTLPYIFDFCIGHMQKTEVFCGYFRRLYI